jgi:hypothetical protein
LNARPAGRKSSPRASSDGISGTNDPRTADTEEYAERMDERAQYYTDFKLWKTLPVPMGYKKPKSNVFTSQALGRDSS